MISKLELNPVLTPEDKMALARARGIQVSSNKVWLRFADDVEQAVLFGLATRKRGQPQYEPTVNEGSEP